MLTPLLEVWERAYRDVALAFEGLAPEHLHRRPGPRALAVSELAAHVARTEWRIVIEGILRLPRDAWPVESPFLDDRFEWAPAVLAEPACPALREMDAGAVLGELLRLHGAARRAMARYEGDPDAAVGAPGSGLTVRGEVTYLGYHVAYHVGQIYLTRHLLGEVPPDN